MPAAIFAQSQTNWEGQVMYHIFPRSFRDSNGDHIGDFKGITQGLDAIQKLGCTMIMLNPIFNSKVYHNYFVDDFFSVDPTLGSMDDFRNMVRAIHKRHMKVILDVEPQYVAQGHPWMQALIKDHNAPEKDYLWSDALRGVGGRSFWYNGVREAMGHVNLDNPVVRATITKMFLFWTDQGLDGFRIDHMMDDLDNKGINKNLLTGFWKPIEDAVHKKNPDSFFVGEQSDWKYGDSILNTTPTNAVFGFPLHFALLSFDKAKIEDAIRNTEKLTPPGKVVVNFLENHDMMRLASAVPDPQKQRLLATLLFTLKGMPAIYYGQELGMKGKQGNWRSDGNDIPVRLAYRWGATLDAPGTATWYAGSGPWADPVYSKDHDGISYTEEDKDPNSLLNFYRKLVNMRQQFDPVLQDGREELVSNGNEEVLEFRRFYDMRRFFTPYFLVVANLSPEPTSIEVDARYDFDMISGKKVGKTVRLEPYQVCVLREDIVTTPDKGIQK